MQFVCVLVLCTCISHSKRDAHVLWGVLCDLSEARIREHDGVIRQRLVCDEDGLARKCSSCRYKRRPFELALRGVSRA